MAATEISVQSVLFKIAADASEMLSEFVASTSSTTVFVARGLLRDPHVTYKDALARIEGKGIRRISAWDSQSEQITVASGFDTAVAANDVVDVIGWDATRRRMMFAAINEAVRLSFPWWWRETIVNAAASSITLAAATDNYSLPADLSALLAIGIQPGANDPIKWWNVKDSPDWFSVEGQEGAFTIRFTPRLNREGGFHQVYAGSKLCAKYATREPEIDGESDTVQLPLSYFVIASAAYQMMKMRQSEKGQAVLDVQQYQILAQMAQQELQKLMLAKVPPNPLLAQPPAPEKAGKKGTEGNKGN